MVVGRCSNKQNHFICVVHFEDVAAHGRTAAAMNRANASCIMKAVPIYAVFQLTDHEQGLISVGNRREPLGTVQTCNERNLTRPICAKSQNHDLIWSANEHFALKSDSLTGELHPGDRIVQAQFPAVIGDWQVGVAALKCEMQIAKHLVTAVLATAGSGTFASEVRIYECFRFDIFAFEQQATYLWQDFIGIGPVSILGGPGPNRIFVEDYPLLVDAARRKASRRGGRSPSEWTQ